MAKINMLPQNTVPLRRPVLRDIAASFLLFLASRASVAGLFPFGAAFFAACCDKGIAYIGVVMLCSGLVSAGAGVAAAKYLIAALLFWIYTKTRPFKSVALDSAVCGISSLVGGLAVIAYTYIGMYDFMLLFAESVASAAVYMVFIKAQMFFEHRNERSNVSQEEIVSVAVSAGIFITGLSGIDLPYGISLSGIVAVYAAMCTALHTNLAATGSSALCLGFMSAMSSPYAIIAGGLYGVSAIFGNLLKSFGRIGIAVGFIGGMSAAMICMQGEVFPLSAADAVIAGALFALTPLKVHKRINIFFSKSLHMEAVSADVRMKEYLSLKLENAANAFKSLNECFNDESTKRLNLYQNEVGGFFDEISMRACGGCTMAVKCWQSDFTRTYKNVITLLETVENDGFITVTSAPKDFKDRCIRSELFLSEFNHVYELYKKDLIRTGEAVSERDIISKQYGEISKILEEMGSDVLEGFSFREDYEESVVSELDKIGITAFEVSVTESALGHIEVYLGLGIGINIEKIEGVLTNLFSVPMGLDKENDGTLLKFISKPRYNVEVSMRRIKSDEAEVSGDSAASFVTKDNKKYIIIADGMGSGKKAMTESRTTLRLLREFLIAGFCVETAVEMVNSSLCLKLEKEMFSTIDLLSVDLITGIAQFYKIGAAESIIAHGDETETVFAASVPAGMIADIKLQAQTKRMSDGDMVLMMSDGVLGTDGGNTEWLKKKLIKDASSADKTAQDIIEGIIEKNGGKIDDDMTVAAVRITEN